MEDILELNTDQLEPSRVDDNLFANRTAAVELQGQTAEVTIIIQAFNRLEKTRRCVKSVLKYTKNVDYELLLIDNGSTDGTFEYFKSVPHKKKKIIHVTKNVGLAYPFAAFSPIDMGRFVCLLGNDIIVTARWMENMLACMKSNPRIGMVTPVSNNVSNFQQVELPYENYEEMQREAARFNQSDPRKWEERLRLITVGTLYRKEVLIAGGWPVYEPGFFHDFADDDISFRIRRMGYQAVLAADTWICHDHDVQHGEDKVLAKYQRSLDNGRENFLDKYLGVDAWDDVNNQYFFYLPHFPAPRATGNVRILGVDVRCGTPILDVKNWLREASVFDTHLSAFTQDPKYWMDLKTICTGVVACDREEFLSDAYPGEYFDYVIADRPLNRYHEPQKIMDDLFSLCKKGGVVTCKLKNTFSFQEYIHLLGQWDVYDKEFSYNLSKDEVQTALERFGTVKIVIATPFPVDEDTRQAIHSLIPAELSERQRAELLQQMLNREYLFVVEKK